MRAKITGIGHYYPEKRLTNKDLEMMVDTNEEWIITRTGIKERRILEDGKGTSDMAAIAAMNALQMANISPDEVELIILCTVSPDMPVPSAAALVQKKLGTNHCWGFDLNAGCSGFLYGLTTGAQFIESGRHRRVLVIGADKMSSIIDYEDRNTCVLFGDAAGAVLLEPSEDDTYGVIDSILRLDGTGAEPLHIKAGGSLKPASVETVRNREHYVFQDGKTVFKHAVTGMANVSAQILEKNNLTGQDIRYLIPHQANLRIIDSTAKRLKLTAEQVVINIEKYGNTTAATIPLALSEICQEKKLSKGDWLVLSAFGAGFTWGSILVKWSLD